MAKKVKEKKGKHRTLLRENYPPAFKIKIPKNRREMLKSEYREEFLIAEAIELETVTQQETVTFVDEDKTKHRLKTRMIFDVKSDENGNVLKVGQKNARELTSFLLLV